MLTVIGIVWFAQEMNVGTMFYLAASAAIVTSFFEPLRRIASRRFFRTSSYSRQTQKHFLEGIRQALDLHMLGTLVVERIQQLIPVERIGFFVLNEDIRRMRLVAHDGFDMLERHGVNFSPEELKTGLEHPIALPEFVEGSVIEVADRPTFERWKIALVVPILKEMHHPLGFIILGKPHSGARFTADDIELLTQISAQAVIALERLLLQQKLLLEQAESQRLDELNRLKSYFVSSVTHDLKTPLTSIRLYAELLRSQLPEEKKISYLTIIEGETNRLARLITNVLDFARIEQGMKAYAVRPVDLTGIVDDALEILRYQLEADGFTLKTQKPEHAVMIVADRDAIIGVIINLVSNAAKYSSEKKCITVTLAHHKASAQLTVADQGIGMDEDSLQKIYTPFYRVFQQSGSGAGLGLSIVKHTLDAHQSSIEVSSTPGIGTTFTITFPLA